MFPHSGRVNVTVEPSIAPFASMTMPRGTLSTSTTLTRPSAASQSWNVGLRALTS